MTDTDRVVQVFAPVGSDGRGNKGTGYLIGDGLVLTARHVIENATGPCEVRALGHTDWVATAVVWRGHADGDGALLRADAPPVDDVGRVRLGRLAGDQRQACEATGFPWAQLAHREGAAVRLAEHLVGEIDPLSGNAPGMASPLLTIHVAGGVPAPTSDGHSPWEGMSGAGLVCGELLVGVVIADPARFGNDRLLAVPLTRLADAPGFAEALGTERGEPVVLEAVEAQGVLERAYEPAPRSQARQTSSFLLGARYGVVPFRARAELDELRAWARTGRRVDVAVLSGAGGVGKTRLGRELCAQLPARESWVTGLLAHGPPAARVSRLAGVNAPVLLVVDYAETRADDVQALLRCLVRSPASRGRRRVLLIARQRGDWWTQLRNDSDDGEVRELLGCARTIGLRAADDAAEDREDAYREAIAAFANHTGVASAGADLPDLSDRLFETLLFVHMAALGSLTADVDAPTARSGSIRVDLLARTLEREQRYWSASARALQPPLQVDEHVRRRAVTVATLATPTTAGAPAGEHETAALLEVVSDLSADTELRHRVARWLHDLYPHSGGWIAPLEPDLLGEALVAETVTALPELARDLLGRADPPTATRALTVLARGSRHHEVCRAALADALDHHLERLAGPAIDVAQQLGDPIGVLLADALERHPNTALARAVLREIPHDTVSLRDVALAARTITTPPPRDVIAGRRVLGSIGQGGYGHVYLVKHLALDRREALKTIHAHVAGDAQHRARFVREGKLQARVRHRNVVEIHDAGEEADGTLWIAMEYVRGTTLRTLLKQRDISREQAALVAESIGNALRAAHAQNVIHRDVKPANVLIEDATGDVKLSDFGIGAGGDLTEITQGGTPRSLAYAAPEQLDGPGTAASDVYALATTLFELVTGRRPFDDVEGSDFALMQAIKERPAPAPSSLIKGHATDWDALLMNALAKNADERPAPDELGARFARAVHESGVVRFPLEAREQRDIRPPSSARLRVSHGGAVRSVAFSADGTRLATAGDDQSARVTDLETGREVLRMIHPWRRWHSRKLLSVALHPDGERIATAGRDDTAQVRHMHNGSVPLVLTHRLWVRTVTFSPNGELIATAGSDGTARVWNLPEERVHLTITSDKPLNAVAFSHDSTRLATAGDDGSACVWDLADTDSQGSGDAGPLSCVTHDDAVWAVAFSPDGRSLATASSDRSAWVSHLGGTSEPLRLEHDGAVWSVAFSPDGRQLATAGADALARVWDLTDFREVLAVEHDDVIFQVTFSPEGHRLATASADHTARVWEL